jgi:predicted GTPase
VPLVSVSGACSRAGKTALAATLLRALPTGTAVALKFTTTEDVFRRCPRGTPCVVCDIDVPFRIVTAPDVLAEPGTDTDRLRRAGAAQVVWVIAKATAAKAAWRAVRERIGVDELVILEGSTIVAHARPDLTVFVAHPYLSLARWKGTSPALIRRADAVIVNRPAEEARPPAAAVLAEIRRCRGRDDVRVADVTQPLAAWAPDLLDRLLRLVRFAAGRTRAGADSPAPAP